MNLFGGGLEKKKGSQFSPCFCTNEESITRRGDGAGGKDVATASEFEIDFKLKQGYQGSYISNV